MATETLVLGATLFINLSTLTAFILQTRYLGAQTASLQRSVEYAAYQNLVEHLNLVNRLIVEQPRVAAVFGEMPFIKEQLDDDESLSIEKIGLAWMILNRYEAVAVGRRLGVVPDSEWDMWVTRLRLDLQIPFVRRVWGHDISNFEYSADFRTLSTTCCDPSRRQSAEVSKAFPGTANSRLDLDEWLRKPGGLLGRRSEWTGRGRCRTIHSRLPKETS